MTTTYVRGTRTHKVTSASVQPGTVLLTTKEFQTLDSPDGEVYVADRKTGAFLRTVSGTTRRAPGRYERVRRVIVHFTDGTHSNAVAPSQTWMAVTEEN